MWLDDVHVVRRDTMMCLCGVNSGTLTSTILKFSSRLWIVGALLIAIYAGDKHATHHRVTKYRESPSTAATIIRIYFLIKTPDGSVNTRSAVGFVAVTYVYAIECWECCMAMHAFWYAPHVWRLCVYYMVNVCKYVKSIARTMNYKLNRRNLQSSLNWASICVVQANIIP